MIILMLDARGPCGRWGGVGVWRDFSYASSQAWEWVEGWRLRVG